MDSEKTYIITGATAGLGLATARKLSELPDTRVVLAVRNTDKARALTQHWQGDIDIRHLDLADLKTVDEFIQRWDSPISGLMNNAGVQIVRDTRFTQREGFEETVTVNHLAALKLTQGLLPHLHHGRVLFIGSGSHHPRNFTAGIFGFRGAQYQSVERSVQGVTAARSLRQAGMDRYATSKFMNMVTTVELARRMTAEDIAFYCLDPGLMAGTGLVRSDLPVMIWGWKYLLPLLAWMLPDSSSVTRSADAALFLLTQPQDSPSGTIFNFNRKPSKSVWEKVLDPAIGKQLVDESLTLLDRRSGM